MSHFTVMVIGENVEQQLAPFQENNMGDCPPEYLKFIVYSEHADDAVFDSEADARLALGNNIEGHLENPRAKWDWWLIGGRWTGYFLPRTGPLKYPRDAKQGEPGVMTEPAREPFVDSIRKCDLDLERMRTMAIDDAKNTWIKYRNAVGSLRPPNIDALRKKFPSPDELRAVLLADPWMTKMREANLPSWDPQQWDVTINQFIDRAASQLLVPHAVLYNDQWRELGQAGMFGTVRNAKSKEVWTAEFWALFNSLPDDALLTIVDCHI